MQARVVAGCVCEGVCIADGDGATLAKMGVLLTVMGPHWRVGVGQLTIVIVVPHLAGLVMSFDRMLPQCKWWEERENEQIQKWFDFPC